MQVLRNDKKKQKLKNIVVEKKDFAVPGSLALKYVGSILTKPWISHYILYKV